MRLLAACLIVGLVLASCGSDDDEASPGGLAGGVDVDDAADGPGGDGGGDASPDDGGGELAAPEIDPAAMPPVGDVRFEIEGATHDFSAADAAQGPAYSCVVDPTSITVELQTQPGQLAAQAIRGDQTRWQGSITIAPPDTDRIYSTTPGADGIFAVDGSMAVYEGEFTWRTTTDPALREPAGVGTVRFSC